MDTAETTRRGRVSRRAALGAATALVAAGSFRGAPAAVQRNSVGSGGGLAGGGTVEVDGGQATFAVSGSRFALADRDEVLFFGRVRWSDPGWEGEGLTLESTTIASYAPVEGAEEDSRELRGRMTRDGEGDYPFTLLAEGIDRPDASPTVTLAVGAAAEATPTAGTPDPGSDDFAYLVEAVPLVAGDLLLLEFDFPEA